MKSAQFSFVETLRFAVCASLEHFLFFLGVIMTWFFSLVGSLAVLCGVVLYTLAALFSQMEAVPASEKTELLKVGADLFSKKLGLMGLVLCVVAFALYCFFALGLTRIMFDIHDRGVSSLGQLFSQGSLVLKGMLVIGLYFLMVGLGLLCFVVPGIIAAVTFCLAPYILVDKRCGALAALQESARLTKGSRMHILALFFILGVLGSVLKLAYLVFWPVTQLALVYVYRQLQMTTASA